MVRLYAYCENKRADFCPANIYYEETDSCFFCPTYLLTYINNNNNNELKNGCQSPST